MILPRPARAVFLAFICWSVAPPVVAATYEETFTPKAGRAYNEDINVWVYTAEFAERFGMPEKWIDDDLKGAYAVAFRVETLSGRKMFPHKGANVSMVRRRCILDVYIGAKADLPWTDDRISDFKTYQPSSASYLLPQSGQDRRWYRQPVGLPDAGDGGVRFGTSSHRLGGLIVRQYDKELYPDVAYISFSKSCATPPDSKSWLEFYYPSDDPRRPKGKRRPVHRIVIPGAYMKRLYDYWYQHSRKPAKDAWGNVLQK